MKRQISLLLIFLSISLTHLFAQAPSIQWQRSYGGSSNDALNAIQLTTDGGYVAIGFSSSSNGDVAFNHGGMDFWMLKMDVAGNIQWQKSLGGSAADFAYDIYQTSDGGYIAAGFSYSTDGDISSHISQSDGWVMKMNSVGAIEWEHSYGGSGNDGINSIQQTNDGGYILAGYSNSFDGNSTGNNGGNDLWILKLSSTGAEEWHLMLGGSSDDQGRCVKQTNDGGYCIVGYANSVDGTATGNHGSSDYFVVKLNANGGILWQKLFGGTQNDCALSFDIAQDGNYVIAGNSSSNDGQVTGAHGGIDQWVIKVDNSGQLIWQKTFGGLLDDSAFGNITTQEGGGIVVGASKSNDGDLTLNHGGTDYWAVKFTSNGVLEWQKSMGGTADEQAKPVLQTSDGGFLIGGHSSSNNGDLTANQGITDYWFVKLNTQTGTKDEVSIDGWNVYPTPFRDELIIHCDNLKDNGVNFQLVDQLGRLVVKGEVSSTDTHLPTQHLESGMYFFTLGNSTLDRLKLIKE